MPSLPASNAGYTPAQFTACLPVGWYYKSPINEQRKVSWYYVPHQTPQP
ncbi:MAG: hypothetical protein LH478_03555 [Chitinophagaceae bacterium]|nr:hypothetical protein [Chitinophagaceae bacterium]